MGRRKQFCPQKTGIPEANESKEPKTEEEEDPSEDGEEESDTHKIKEEEVEDEEIGRSSLDSIKGPSSEEINSNESSSLVSPFGVSPAGQHDFASTILAAQQSLLHPAALFSLNPSSLYAVQLAQLQAAQLLSQPPLKRKLNESSEDSPSSPLDLSGPSNKVMGGPESSPLPSPPKRASFDAVSPLDKISEMSKGKPRHSAWQSQWINRGEENAKDIFKCTWCKECFHSFQALTHHMKETKHFGTSAPPATSPFKNSSPLSIPSSTAAPVISPTKSIPSTPPSSCSQMESSENSSSASKKRDILKEQLPIPRKLVRGQDVWLGKGEEQTRNILKCMWCGESFRSLDVMTKHMQETKHYTKVISQDQISSWKSNSVSNGGGPPTSSSTVPPSPASPSKDNNKEQAMNSILTCKVCETSFQTLKDLSDHMIKNNHCINTTTTTSKSSPIKNNSPPATLAVNNNNNNNMNFAFPPKEKRKKSLPVKKLLELERSHEKGATMKFPCDKCGISFPFHLFAEHIRNCTGNVPSPRQSPEQKRPESHSPPTNHSSRNSPLSRASEGRSKSRDGNILGSLEQMVSGNFKGLPVKDDVVIPVIKEGQDEDIAVDEDETASSPLPKSSPKPKDNTNKNPLEALQMLCDKNEKHTQNFYGGGSGANPHILGGGSSSPTDSMGFPWSPSPEALFKCPFCETPFVSKGAYRNHLSKMHFVKDPSVMMMMDPASIMALAAGIPSGFFPPPGGAAAAAAAAAGNNNHLSLSGFQPPPASTSPECEENSTSKFEKYSQLAKQLSNQRKPLSSPA